MADSKKEKLIKEGKELGLNLKSSMSIYELEHRIEDKKSQLKKKEEEAPKKSSKRARGGEY